MTVHFEKLVSGFSRHHEFTLRTELRALLPEMRVAKQVKAIESLAGCLQADEQVDSVPARMRDSSLHRLHGVISSTDGK